MYDYGNRDGDGVTSAGIGSYCLMGAGNHLNNGRTPAPVCAYLRELAGWCDIRIDLSQPGMKEARHSDYRTVMKYPTDKFNEYFIVENRTKMGLDQHLPSSGLAVYHCDTDGSNELQEGSSTRHYQCALLQADGRMDLERNGNRGDGGDLFGAIGGTALSHATTPSSRQWDNVDSRLVLSQISAPATVINFRVGPEVVGQVVTLEVTPGLAIPDNNPAGISSQLALNQAGLARRIRTGVGITHTFIGDLQVELVSPSGDRALIHDRKGGDQDNLQQTFDSSANAALAALIGKPAAGNWELRVRDIVGQDTGRLDAWKLEIELDGLAQPGGTARSSNRISTIPDNESDWRQQFFGVCEPGNDETGPFRGADRTHLHRRSACRSIRAKRPASDRSRTERRRRGQPDVGSRFKLTILTAFAARRPTGPGKLGAARHRSRGPGRGQIEEMEP